MVDAHQTVYLWFDKHFYVYMCIHRDWLDWLIRKQCGLTSVGGIMAVVKLLDSRIY